jgi:hypothetical protein
MPDLEEGLLVVEALDADAETSKDEVRRVSVRCV